MQTLWSLLHNRTLPLLSCGAHAVVRMQQVPERGALTQNEWLDARVYLLEE